MLRKSFVAVSHVGRPLAKHTRYLIHHNFQLIELMMLLYRRDLREIHPRYDQSVYLPIHLRKHSCCTPRSRERSYSTDIDRSFPSICKTQITTKDNDLRQRLNISICCRRAAKTSEIPTSRDTYCTMEIHPKTCFFVWWFLGTTHWSY